MHIFEYIHQLRTFERKHLAFVETLEDLDIINLVGLHQEQGESLTLKHILAFNIGSVATIERRLARLKRLGIILQARSHIDKRNVELKLNPKINRVFQRYATMLKANQLS